MVVMLPNLAHSYVVSCCIKIAFYYQNYVPHVGDFVALNGSNIFLGLLIRTFRVEQESARTTCD